MLIICGVIVCTYLNLLTLPARETIQTDFLFDLMFAFCTGELSVFGFMHKVENGHVSWALLTDERKNTVTYKEKIKLKILAS